MPRLNRLDAELVRRREAADQAEAHVLIAEGRVKVDGGRAANPNSRVPLAAAIVVDRSAGSEERYVSRGGVKLAGALDALGPDAPAIEGRDCLDAGAAAGGFTDVLLRRGARHVTAADTGYGQLAWRLRQDARVTVRDRSNVRLLRPGDISPVPSLVVADLSFISLTAVLPALTAVASGDADMLLMVKPQFEAPRADVGEGGVVTDPRVRASAIERVATDAIAHGLAVRAIVPSPLPGPRGNVEYFVLLQASAPDPGLQDAQLRREIDRCVESGGAT